MNLINFPKWPIVIENHGAVKVGVRFSPEGGSGKNWRRENGQGLLSEQAPS